MKYRIRVPVSINKGYFTYEVEAESPEKAMELVSEQGEGDRVDTDLDVEQYHWSDCDPEPIPTA